MSSVNRLLVCKHYRVGGDGSKICVNDLQFPIPVILSEIRVIAAGQTSAAMFVGETQEEPFVLEIFAKDVDVADSKFEALTRGTQSVRVRKSARITRLKGMRTAHVAFRGKYQRLSLCLYGRVPSSDPNLNALQSVTLPRLDLPLDQKCQFICAAESDAAAGTADARGGQSVRFKALKEISTIRMAKEVKLSEILQLLDAVAKELDADADADAKQSSQAGESSDPDVADGIVCTILERAVRKTRGTGDEKRARRIAFHAAEAYFGCRGSQAMGLLDLADEVFMILEAFVEMTENTGLDTVVSCLHLLRTLIMCARGEALEKWLSTRRWYSTLVAMTLFLRSDAVATSLASSLLLIWYSFVKVAGFVRRANLAQSFTSPDACNVLSELLDSTERLLRENSGSSERHPEENQLLLRRLSALIVERARSQGVAEAWCALLEKTEDSSALVVMTVQILSVWQDRGILDLMLKRDISGYARLLLKVHQLLERLPPAGAVVVLRPSFQDLGSCAGGLPVPPLVFVKVCVDALCAIAASFVVNSQEETETRRQSALNVMLRSSTTAIGQAAIALAFSDPDVATAFLEVANRGAEPDESSSAAIHILATACGANTSTFSGIMFQESTRSLAMSLIEKTEKAGERSVGAQGRNRIFQEALLLDSTRMIRDEGLQVGGETREASAAALRQIEGLLSRYDSLTSEKDGQMPSSVLDKNGLLDLTAVLCSLTVCIEASEARLGRIDVNVFRCVGSEQALKVVEGPMSAAVPAETQQSVDAALAEAEKPNTAAVDASRKPVGHDGDADDQPASGTDAKPSDTEKQMETETETKTETVPAPAAAASVAEEPAALSVENDSQGEKEMQAVARERGVGSEGHVENEGDNVGGMDEGDGGDEGHTDPNAFLSDDALAEMLGESPGEVDVFLDALRLVEILGSFLAKVRSGKLLTTSLELESFERRKGSARPPLGQDVDDLCSRRRFQKELCSTVGAVLSFQAQVCRVFENAIDALLRHDAKQNVRPLLEGVKAYLLDADRAHSTLQLVAQTSLLVTMYLRTLQLQTNSPSMVYGPGLGISYKLGFGFTTQSMIKQPAVESYFMSPFQRSCMGVHAAASVLFARLCRIYKKVSPPAMGSAASVAQDPLLVLRNMLSESSNGAMHVAVMLWYVSFPGAEQDDGQQQSLRSVTSEDCAEIMDDDLVYSITLQLIQSSDAYLLDLAAELCRNTMKQGRGTRLAPRLVRMVLDSLSRDTSSAEDTANCARSARTVIFALHLLQNEQLRRELNASSTFPPLKMETTANGRSLQKACLLALQCQVESIFGRKSPSGASEDVSKTPEAASFLQRLAKLLRELQGSKGLVEMLKDAPDIARDVCSLQMILRTHLPETVAPKPEALANLLGYEGAPRDGKAPTPWPNYSLDNAVNLSSIAWGLGFLFCCIESRRAESAQGIREVYPDLVQIVENVRGRVNFARASLKGAQVTQQKVLDHLKGLCDLILGSQPEQAGSPPGNPDPTGDLLSVYSLESGWTALEAAYFQMVRVQPDLSRRPLQADTEQDSKKRKVEGS